MVRLRSGKLRMDQILDLNLIQDPNVTLSQEGRVESHTVSKSEGKSSGLACQEKVVGGNECNSIEAKSEEISKVNSEKPDACSASLVPDSPVSEEGKEMVSQDEKSDEPLKPDSSGVKESNKAEERNQGSGRVLRSGVVPATPNKRKRDITGLIEDSDTVKNKASKTPKDSKRVPGRKTGDLLTEEIVELDKRESVTPLKSSQRKKKLENACKGDGEVKKGKKKLVGDSSQRRTSENITPLKSSQRKKKLENACEGEDEVRNGKKKLVGDSSQRRTSENITPLKSSQRKKKLENACKGEDEVRNGKKKLVGDSSQRRTSENITPLKSSQKKKKLENACKGEDEVRKGKKKLVGNSSQRRTSERSKKVIDYCEKSTVRRIFSGCKTNDQSEDKDEGLSNVKVASSQVNRKRGRPKKVEGIEKVLSYDNDENGKSNKKLSGEETSSTPSVKRKRGINPASVSEKKKLISNQIVDMLLSSGWTIEHRPRSGREYCDAVYVNREGKTHWSVTKAYYSLQQEFEQIKTITDSEGSKSNISFTPLPEEELRKLFRVVSKTRTDKKKKKKCKEDDDASEKVTMDKNEIKKKKKQLIRRVQTKRWSGLVARRSNELNSESTKGISYLGKNSVISWLIDSGEVNIGCKVQLMNCRKTKTFREGTITRDGVNCNCCDEVFSISEFEKHAGSQIDQPYENLILEGGQSLLLCMLDSWNKQDAEILKESHCVNVNADDPNDDTCAICGDGGDLMCCDGCPSTFHNGCLNIEEVPPGDWHCAFCSCKFCGDATQMTDDLDSAPFPLINCFLCDEKYHRLCADEYNLVHTESGSESFCGKNCQQIFAKLQTLVGVKKDLEDGFSWSLIHRFDLKGNTVSLDTQKIQNNSKLAVALSVMDECFAPIIDQRSGLNLIRHVVYNSGSNFRRLNFRNFVTIVLEKGDEVISAASIRIHGKVLAEMPFIGTRNSYRRQGMCRRLLAGIEQALSSLGVENLVIPAIPELLDTWTSVFGFRPLEESIKEEMSLMNMLVFAHTDMLQKQILVPNSFEKPVALEENVGEHSKSSKELFDLNIPASDISESPSFEVITGCEGLPTSMEINNDTAEGDMISDSAAKNTLDVDPCHHKSALENNECLDSDSRVACKSVTQVSSDSSCNISSSAAGESGTTNLSFASDPPKDDSN